MPADVHAAGGGLSSCRQRPTARRVAGSAGRPKHDYLGGTERAKRASDGDQRTTLKTAVAMMLTRERGMRNFQAKAWSWSSRKRGKGKRIQKIRKAMSMIVAPSTSGPRTAAMIPVWKNGWYQPPK